MEVSEEEVRMMEEEFEIIIRGIMKIGHVWQGNPSVTSARNQGILFIIFLIHKFVTCEAMIHISPYSPQKRNRVGGVTIKFAFPASILIVARPILARPASRA